MIVVDLLRPLVLLCGPCRPGLKEGRVPAQEGKLDMVDGLCWRARAMRALCVVVCLLNACGDDSKSNSAASSVMTSGAAGAQQPKRGVSGTGNSCESYTLPNAEMCGSWYCGVSLQTLKGAVAPAAVCGSSVELICTGSAVATVADCARMIKVSMPFASNEQLRPMVRDCALKDTELQQGARNECLDCIFDGFACTADNCLVQCLAGNSPDCDKCRLDAKCDQKSFECAGLPWPRD